MERFQRISEEVPNKEMLFTKIEIKKKTGADFGTCFLKE